MKLSVIIVNYNSCDDLARCLASLREYPPSCPHEVVVVDNASRESGLGAVRDRHPDVRWVMNAENAGYARGVNRGLAEVDAEWALVLNPDIQVLPGAIDALLAVGEARPRAGVLGPQLLNEDGSIQASARRFYTLRTLLLRRTPLGRVFPGSRSVREHLMLDFDFRSERAVDWVLGGAMLVRRAARQRTGPLDERFFLYFEDVDWCFRMWQAGWEVLYTPASRMVHKHRRASAGGALRRAFWLHMGSMISFYEKWGLLLYLIKRWRGPLSAVTLWLLDLAALDGALLLAYGARVLLNPLFPEKLFPLAEYRPLFVYATLLASVTFVLRGRYRRRDVREALSPFATAPLVGLVAVLLLATTYLSHQRVYSRPVLLLFVPIFAVALGFTGALYGALRRRMDRGRADADRTILVGREADWTAWLAARGDLARAGLDVVGRVDDAPPPSQAPRSDELPWLGPRAELADLADRARIAQVLFWDAPRAGEAEDALLRALRRAGVRLRWRLDDDALLVGARTESWAGAASLVLEPAARPALGRTRARAADRASGLLLVLVAAIPWALLRAFASRDARVARHAWRRRSSAAAAWLPLVEHRDGRARGLVVQAPLGWALLAGRVALMAADGGPERATAIWTDLAAEPEAFPRAD